MKLMLCFTPFPGQLPRAVQGLLREEAKSQSERIATHRRTKPEPDVNYGMLKKSRI
jgi:hypothetical protein